MQSSLETHDIKLIGEKRKTLKWDGKLIDKKILESAKKAGLLFPLTTSFRMTDAIHRYIEKQILSPQIFESNPCGVEGAEVVPKIIETKVQDECLIQFLVEVLVEQVTDTVKKNIHNGQVMILFDSQDMELLANNIELFPEKIIKSLSLNAKSCL